MLKYSILLLCLFLTAVSCAEYTLYQFETCPFCARVRQHLNDHNILYKTINVSRNRSDPVRLEIAKASKVSTVPVLKIVEEGKSPRFIGDSGKIIQYFETSVF
ncbi:hypothetical protein RCL1_000878 [Eukaryota sp. TZLM3-RCL]